MSETQSIAHLYHYVPFVSYSCYSLSDKHGMAVADSYTCGILSAVLQGVPRKISESSNVTVRRVRCRSR